MLMITLSLWYRRLPVLSCGNHNLWTLLTSFLSLGQLASHSQLAILRLALRGADLTRPQTDRVKFFYKDKFESLRPDVFYSISSLTAKNQTHTSKNQLSVLDKDIFIKKTPKDSVRHTNLSTGFAYYRLPTAFHLKKSELSNASVLINNPAGAKKTAFHRKLVWNNCTKGCPAFTSTLRNNPGQAHRVDLAAVKVGVECTNSKLF